MKRTLTEIEGEYIIRVMDLPTCSKGFVVYDDNDFANVYINARYSHSTQAKAIKHEIDHIIHDDIHNQDDIRTIESRANR